MKLDRQLPRSLAVCGAAVLLFGLLGCRAAEPPRHLILVTVDTLRADHMSLYGYGRETTPFLETLASGGVTFDRAIAQWPKTGASFASIFSGLYPQTSGLTHRAALDLPPDLETLPALLRRHGFRSVAVISNPVLSRELGWAAHFDEYVETWDGTESNDPFVYRPRLAAGRVNDLAADLLRRHADAGRLFAWIHFSDPHAPYVLPAGRANPFFEDALWGKTAKLEPDLTGTRGRAIPSVRSLREYVSLYDANVLETDRGIASLFEVLEADDLVEGAAIVVTADHGESLGEHGLYFEHGPLAHNPGVHVPLILSGPGVEKGNRIGEPAELVDLLPTVCEWLALACPESIDGASLWPRLRGQTEPGRVAFSEAGSRPRHLRSVQDERFKLVHHGARGQQLKAGRFELFDLERDPGELHDILDTEPEQARRLQRALAEWSASARGEGDLGPLSPAQRRALDAMGYTQ